MAALDILYYIIAASLLAIIVILSFIAYQIAKLLITFRKLAESALSATSSVSIFKDKMLVGALGAIGSILSLILKGRR